MAMPHTIETTFSPRGIATVRLNRPARSNAFDQAMLGELAREFAERAADPATRILVIRGSGKHFCAGADLAARAAERDGATGAPSLVAVLAALDRFPAPTIAAVHGGAVGGGAAIAACCDVVLAAEDAFFSVPEVRVGMAPLGVAPFLIRAMGQRNFRRYGLSGERITAAEALRIGLAHQTTSADRLDDRLNEIADALLHGAPGAQRTLKDEIERYAVPSVAGILPSRAPHDASASAEAGEGIASFKEKRKPSWYPQ
jgi:methylglutaconyl-CoA hydratase